MYDELIKELRGKHRAYVLTGNEKPGKIFEEAADAIEELSRENGSLAKSVNEASEILRRRWIPVTERLPEEDESVFVVRKFLGIKGQVPPSTYTEIAYRIGDNWYADSDEYKIARSKHTDPLYWMPLPELPKGE